MTVLQRIRGAVIEKRRNLSDWLQVAPPENTQLRLGPSGQQPMRAHLQVLDQAAHRAADGSLGICDICHEPVEPERLEMDYTTSICISHYTQQQLQQLESELELSQAVQRGLLPQAAPAIPGMDVALFSRPAQILGGDYVDFFQFSDGAYGLAIADVAGHGVSASLLMASVQAALRALIPNTDSPAQVLAHVNRLFVHNIHFTTFVTLFLGRFDPAGHALLYCNAGHNPPLVMHQNGVAGGSFSWLDPTGAAIGLVEDFEVGTGSAPLAPGDMLLLYTDGVTEAANPSGELFGSDRLVTLTKGSAQLPASRLVQSLRSALDDWSEGQPLADDTTIVACRVAA